MHHYQQGVKMKMLEIQSTKSSPYIKLDPSAHEHWFKGESYPENTSAFYSPIIDWIEAYVGALQTKTVFNFEIIYFNSSTSKIFLEIFDALEDAAEEGKDITVNWRFEEDNDAAEEYGEEYGEEFAEDYESLTFNLVTI